MTYQIIWEKWRDPYGADDPDPINLLGKNNDTIDDRTYDTSIDEENDTDYDEHFKILKQTVPMMITPIGMVPYTENTASSKIFNFWTGHCNFNITKKISELIEESEGVETLDIFTRYRFRISIGKAFNDAATMTNINNKIYSYLNE